MTPTNPNTETVKTATRYVLMLGALWLADHGYLSTTDVAGLVTAVMILAPAAWGMWNNYNTAHRAKMAVTEAVNVGIRAGADNPALANESLTSQDAHALVATSVVASQS